MDDLALLDLLECPVCFEKLDGSAKVLPCQHTFCKPCLQRILKCQKELRCPECRTLVLCSIEQLPSNLLLIRLLDGARCGQNVARFGSMQRAGLLSSPASIRRVPRGLQLSQYRLAPAPRIHMEGVPRAKALYSYRGHNPGELRFNKGDIIMLLRQLDENWYLGEINGISGVFPASSVQVIKHLPLPPPLCRALYNFDLRSRDKNENKDCLTFHKGDIITVISRVDENWAEGKLGDKVGIFPILFVEPNTTARKLLQTSKSHQAPQFKCASPSRTTATKSKGADSPAFHKASDSRRKSLRQFSITTALNTLNRMVHSPAERQALEISSPVLISSSNPTVATQSSEKGELPCGVPVQQVSASYYPAPGSLGHSAAIVTLPHLQHHISANMKPNLSDSKMPSLYTSWTLSTASLSSQGSISENGQRQSRPLKPVLLPVPVPSPGRNAALLGPSAQASLRRGRGSARKNGSLQRPGQAGTPVHVAGSLRRLPATAARPLQFQLYQHVSSAGAGMADAATRPNFSHDVSPALVLRGGESKTPSVCSSVILDVKDLPAKSEAAPKPPASAPPSILVKPDTSRNSTEKQVKTVRFQNQSPPPPKRHSLQPSPRLPRGPAEQGAQADTLAADADGSLLGPRLSASPLHQRRAKAASLDLAGQAGQLTFPLKKSYSSISAN
ncbi:E3 ubiquitin-protein ligase SH3RF2 [Nothoprocta perdicaria]|uniref:E3 ubiquitin-protein ligase SH3RF2 n=1 Tax=Nothoprocta perdicaria TaxID=30464 RepID=UPI000E1B94A6|nr:E3 ubiquitin-protein ligase SH3RF2 [Nothoprocta perdicaria]